MFTTLIVQPIFNLLVLIYALIPGHNFGLAIIIFTIVIRLLMYPLVKKQLHHAKAIRALQPELKKIKAATKGDKRKEQMLTMELYRERQIKPIQSLAIVFVQLPILLGLYIGLKKTIDHPQAIINFSYPALHHLSWMQTLAHDIHRFDNTLFGVIDLTRTAVGPKGLYWPALLIVIGSALAQFFQSKQLLPKSKDSRSLKKILSEAGKGKSADQMEVNAAVGRSTMYLIPLFVFFVSLRFAAALPLYWLTGALVAFWQQSRILKEDVEEAEAVADAPTASAQRAAGSVEPKAKKAKPGNRKRRRKK